MRFVAFKLLSFRLEMQVGHEYCTRLVGNVTSMKSSLLAIREAVSGL